jgi:hypothetical protein
MGNLQAKTLNPFARTAPGCLHQLQQHLAAEQTNASLPTTTNTCASSL